MTKQLVFQLVICFSFLAFMGCPKSISHQEFVSNLNLNTGVYILVSGSNDKTSNLIKDYNYVGGSTYSHVSLLILDKNKRIVYDVHPRKVKFQKKISKQSIEEFLNYHFNISYLSIWLVENLDIELSKSCIQENRVIRYDFKFDNYDDDALYCSEFVAKTLNCMFCEPFDWILLTKDTYQTERKVLKKDILTYYPVDFFLNNVRIKLVDEWILN